MGKTANALDEALFMHSTEHQCAECEEELEITGIVSLVQIVLPQQAPTGELIAVPFVRPGTDEYAYEPFFYHDGCWARNQDTLCEFLDEHDVQKVEDPYAVCICNGCGSGIRPNEPSGMVQTGEFQRSERSPNGGRSVHFHAYPEMTQYFCLACTRVANDEIIEMWDHISYAGECDLCTYDRNWRTGAPCTHQENNDGNY